MRPETRYARTTDGVYLAYQVVGSGPDVAVDFHLFAGNVDLIWEEPDWVGRPDSFWNYPRPRLAWDPDYPWGQRPEDFERAMVEVRNWGSSASRPGSSHRTRRPRACWSRSC